MQIPARVWAIACAFGTLAGIVVWALPPEWRPVVSPLWPLLGAVIGWRLAG